MFKPLRFDTMCWHPSSPAPREIRFEMWKPRTVQPAHCLRLHRLPCPWVHPGTCRVPTRDLLSFRTPQRRLSPILALGSAFCRKLRNHKPIMGRSSPSIRRMVALLDFFADHPGNAYTLASLVRALRLSPATCHALLAGLVDSGYLYRMRDKSYVIGPRLVTIGQVAKAHFSPLQVAQPEM